MSIINALLEGIILAFESFMMLTFAVVLPFLGAFKYGKKSPPKPPRFIHLKLFGIAAGISIFFSGTPGCLPVHSISSNFGSIFTQHSIIMWLIIGCGYFTGRKETNPED